MRINLTMIHSDTIEEYETTHNYTPEKKAWIITQFVFKTKKEADKK